LFIHPTITSDSLFCLITNHQYHKISTNLFTWSLDRRAPVERWSGHYQRLEEKMDGSMEEMIVKLSLIHGS
ncbi:hypothetical protein KCU87_g281, partial [Aureobasidium melanogenum]